MPSKQSQRMADSMSPSRLSRGASVTPALFASRLVIIQNCAKALASDQLPQAMKQINSDMLRSCVNELSVTAFKPEMIRFVESDGIWSAYRETMTYALSVLQTHGLPCQDDLLEEKIEHLPARPVAPLSPGLPIIRLPSSEPAPVMEPELAVS